MEPQREATQQTVRTRPFLSVALPSYSAGAHLVARTLHSYAGQRDLSAFEVLVVDDGALDDRVREVAHRDWPFAVRYLVSPRVRDETKAHKNHARNVGWRNAAGDLVFMVDGDCMARKRQTRPLPGPLDVLRSCMSQDVVGPARQPGPSATRRARRFH